jgi:hypothetical protein
MSKIHLNDRVYFQSGNYTVSAGRVNEIIKRHRINSKYELEVKIEYALITLENQSLYLDENKVFCDPYLAFSSYENTN